jgi:dephospho-CoA kinase
MRMASHLGNVRLMAVILVTGMSGVGKSTALAQLARRGHLEIDTRMPAEEVADELERIARAER